MPLIRDRSADAAPSGRLLLYASIVLACAVAYPVIAATVQDRHSFDVPRERDRRVDGTFTLAMGSVTIGEAERGQLFQARVDMEDDRLTPSLDVHRGEGTATLRMGLAESSRGGVSLRGLRDRSRNSWQLFFDRQTPLDLRFDLGMANADLDLTGFRVRSLAISAGMADTRLTFGRRNPVEMERLVIEAGAARFHAEGLGNARVREMSFSGGAGSFDLDFTGARLPAGGRARVDVGLSRLRIRLPEHQALVLHAPESWLTRVDVPDGYTRHSRGVWHSPRVRDSDDAFHVHVRAGIGRVRFETVASR